MAGIPDAGVIDLVFQDPRSEAVTLVMCETRPWGSDPDQLDQLVAKINAYAAYVLDEGFTLAFPGSADKPIRIQIDCVDAPDQATAEVVDAATQRLAEYGVAFVVNELGPPT